MRVIFATSEIAPWSKTGGLGDVAAALPCALHRLGVDVRVLTPCYPSLHRAFPHAAVVARCHHLGGHFPAVTLRAAALPNGTPLLLLDCPEYYDRHGGPYANAQHHDWPDNHLRFGLLSRVAAWLGSGDAPPDLRSDIVHGNDWQAGLAPVYLHADHRCHASSIMTVHNLAFHGSFAHATLHELGLPASCWRFDGVEFHGKLSFLKAGLQYADALTTVSPSYADEICNDEGGMGLAPLLRYRRAQLSGILNGIDTAEWNPADDPHIAACYDMDRLDVKATNKAALQREFGLAVRNDLPLLGVVSRLTWQKGLDLLPPIAADVAALPAQLVVLGSGDAVLEREFTAMAMRHAERCAVRISFDEALAHRIIAGADMFLMPSRFEPCGLAQMQALRYGTLPVVRATGGLADTVVDGDPASANGFRFQEATSDALLSAIRRAAETWRDVTVRRRLQRNGMSRDSSWLKPARDYLALYAATLAA